MNSTIKQNLLQGRSMKSKSNDAKLLYFNAIEAADGSGLFDAQYALDAFNLPLTALMELVDAKLLLYFEDENVAAITHWNLIVNKSQRSKGTLFPEVKSHLVVRNGKYYIKDKSNHRDAG